MKMYNIFLQLIVFRLLKKMFFVMLILGYITNPLSAQTQLQLWTAPPKKIDFGNITQAGPAKSNLPIKDYTGVAANYSHNVWYDKQGQLLFFIVDGIIYDKDGYKIENINYSSNDINREVAIIPIPGSCRKFYIISGGVTYNSNSTKLFMRFDSLDLDEPNYYYNTRWGAVNSVNVGSTSNYKPLNNIYYDVFFQCRTVQFAVTPLRSDNTRLLYIEGCRGFKKYIITNNGINIDQYYFLDGNGFAHQRSEMEIIRLPNGQYKLAMPYIKGAVSSPPSIYLATLDQNGNLLNGNLFYSTPSISVRLKGMEFSPNGQYLYCTMSSTTTPIIYFNLASSSPSTPITLSVTNATHFKESQIEIAYDGNLYFAGNNTTNTYPRMARLKQPNNPTTGNWQDPVPSLNGVNIPLSQAGVGNNTFALRTLPDQLDGENYSNIFIQSKSCCNGYTSWNATNFNATQSATWTLMSNPIRQGIPPHGTSAAVKIDGELRIKTGVDITIKDMEFEFSSNGKIIVENGAKLSILGTKCTGNSDCKIMWQGIQVYGDDNAPQVITKGLVVNNNGNNKSIIEQADIAVEIIDGGYADIQNSIIRDNYYGLFFRSSDWDINKYDNNSIINYNTFETTSNKLYYPHEGIQSNTFVISHQVTGIAIDYNTFRDSYHGIIGLNAANMDIHFNTFTNISYTGINLTHTLSTLSKHDIANNTFDYVGVGPTGLYQGKASIRIDGGSNDFINNNIIRNSINTNNLVSGITLFNCKTFDVRENNISRQYNPIFLFNTNTDSESSSVVCDNTIVSSPMAINAGGANKGVQIRCNNQNNYTNAGWYIHHETINGVYHPALLNDQGKYTDDGNYLADKPDGNNFYRSNFTNLDIYTTATFTLYYHPDNTNYPDFNQGPVTVIPANDYIGKSYDCLLYCSGSGKTTNDLIVLIAQTADPIEKGRLIRQLVNAYNENNQGNDAIALLETLNTVDAKKMLIPFYIKENRINDARILLPQIPVNNDKENEHFVKYHAVMCDIYEAKLVNNWQNYTADSLQMQSLREVSNGWTSTAANAQAMLKILTGEEFIMPEEAYGNLNTIVMQKHSSDHEQTDTILKSVEKQLYFSNPYPNPSANAFVINYYLPETTSKAEFHIYDVTGKKIIGYVLQNSNTRVNINIQSFENGVYIYKFLADGVIVKQNKLLIVK